MIREVVVRPEAEQDIREAHSWYLGVSYVLAEQFVASVDEAVTKAATNPLAFQVLHRSLRRVFLRRFPYARFFAAEESRIVVVGVLHQGRDPRVAQQRR